MAATAAATITLSSVDHSAFNVTSIDLAKLLMGPFALNGSVTFYGTKAGTSTPVVQKFDYTGNWTTFWFNPNFTDLSSLSWSQGVATRFEFDNINITSAVPEAETWAMLLAGLGMLGWVARRQRA
ncbi:PEP-CTERM sorting domain-containing protein [Pseudoduganella sp. FT26W]|uniref:PEP-CTERM sorting domain-containing protein n=2 Tax=Duganella aquatilis TaxID=2666082 RepID=A0A844D652_9BURK|nr:PEP-CTERM sorting domain-containing protein [Duganella aquatilis]